MNENGLMYEYFQLYMSKVCPIGANSRKKYSDAIKGTLSRLLQDKGIIDCNLFDITNTEELNAVCDILVRDEDFLALNKRGNNMYSCAIKKYQSS